jgi:hypothetical protein
LELFSEDLDFKSKKLTSIKFDISQRSRAVDDFLIRRAGTGGDVAMLALTILSAISAVS